VKVANDSTRNFLPSCFHELCPNLVFEHLKGSGVSG
jgi:hypothetical protein